MKKSFFVGIGIVTSVFMAVFLLLPTAGHVYFLFASRPSVAKAASSTPAPKGAKPGYVFDAGKHSLSIVSDRDVVVVSDPGKAFRYEVTWLVPRTVAAGTHRLTESRYDLPYADADHINAMDASIPPEILKTARGGGWN